VGMIRQHLISVLSPTSVVCASLRRYLTDHTYGN